MSEYFHNFSHLIQIYIQCTIQISQTSERFCCLLYCLFIDLISPLPVCEHLVSTTSKGFPYIYCCWPVHPLWQIKQIVTIGGQQYVDCCMWFGTCSAACIWWTFMGLVMWITIHVKRIHNPLHYMDDAWSYDMDPRLHLYKLYTAFSLLKQVQMLQLWDEIGLPPQSTKASLWHNTLHHWIWHQPNCHDHHIASWKQAWTHPNDTCLYWHLILLLSPSCAMGNTC